MHQKEIPLKTRLINHFCFYEEGNKLITAGVDGVLVFQFDIKRRPNFQRVLQLLAQVAVLTLEHVIEFALVADDIG